MCTHSYTLAHLVNTYHRNPIVPFPYTYCNCWCEDKCVHYWNTNQLYSHCSHFQAHKQIEIHTHTHARARIHAHSYHAFSERKHVFPRGSVSPLSSSSLYFLGDSCHPVRPMAAMADLAAYSVHWHTPHTQIHQSSNSTASAHPVFYLPNHPCKHRKHRTEPWALTSKSCTSVASPQRHRNTNNAWRKQKKKRHFCEIQLSSITNIKKKQKEEKINITSICVSGAEILAVISLSYLG